MQREFRRQARDVRALFNRSTKQLDEEESNAIIEALIIQQRAWETRLSNEIYPNMETLIANSLRAVEDEIGIGVNLDNTEAKDFVKSYSFKFAQKVSQTSADRVRGIILKSKEEGNSLREVRQNLNAEFTQWSAVRTRMVARTETIRASNYGARFGYQQSGVEEMEWLASSDACGYCQSLDGTKLPTTGTFLDVGSEIVGAEGTPEAGKVLRNNYEPVGAPPAHPNCRCTIIPVV